MFHLISVTELVQLQASRKLSIIDIRDPEEYDKGHIPKAVNVTDFFYYLSESTEKGMEELIQNFQDLLNNNGISNSNPIVIYEEEMDKKYGGSCRGAFIMTLLGHEEVYVLHGGYTAWKHGNQEISINNTITNTAAYTIKLNKNYFADYNDMSAAIDNSDIYILDNRDKAEWIGKSSSPYGIDYSPRKGRIPGAHWLEWYTFLEEINGIPMFKSDEEIRKIAKEHGISPNLEIIIYCFKGSRAANTLLALNKAGFGKAKVYFASWYEWAKNPELPIDASVLE